jgi:hypothetical protein
LKTRRISLTGSKIVPGTRRAQWTLVHTDAVVWDLSPIVATPGTV